MPLLISLLPFFICPYMMRSVEDYCRTNHTASSVTLAPATMTLPIVIHDLPVRHKHRLLCNIPYNPYLWYGNEATVLHILGQIWSTGNHSKEWLPFIFVDDQLGRVGRPLLSGILGIRQDSFYLWEAGSSHLHPGLGRDGWVYIEFDCYSIPLFEIETRI